jgi:hypothetical protein
MGAVGGRARRERERERERESDRVGGREGVRIQDLADGKSEYCLLESTFSTPRVPRSSGIGRGRVSLAKVK